MARLTPEQANAVYGDTLAPGHIRLFTLAPAPSEFSPLRGTLETYENTKAPNYEAISYKQGEDRDFSFVEFMVRGGLVRLRINDTLYYALKRLRQQQASRLLWSDVININQDDNIDKSRNVGNIHQIYGSAKLMLIWLGTGTEESDRAMESIPRMMAILSRARSREEIVDQDFRIGAYRTPGLVALRNLFDRSWFHRVWTLQEGAFASRARVLCGERELDFSLLETLNARCQLDASGVWTGALSAITSARPAHAQAPTRFVTDHIHAISQLKEFRTSHGAREPVQVLLYRLRSVGAWDPRDRIYSMWPLVSHRYSQVMREPRYEGRFTTEELFHQVALAEIVRLGNLECLGEAGLWNRRQDNDPREQGEVKNSEAHEDLPSWVADWRYRNLTHPFWLLDHDCFWKTGQKLYSAGIGPPNRAQVSDSDRVLTVMGKVMGEIKELGELFTFPTNPDDNANAMVRYQRMVEILTHRKRQMDSNFEIIRSHWPHTAQTDAYTAWRRTLVAGLKPQGAGSGLGGVFIKAEDEEIRECFDSSDFAQVRKILDVFQDVGKSRRLFIAGETCYVGLAPSIASETDVLAVIFSCSTPFILRPVENGAYFQLIGECYAAGLMDGEALKMDEIPARDIRLC